MAADAFMKEFKRVFSMGLAALVSELAPVCDDKAWVDVCVMEFENARLILFTTFIVKLVHRVA